MVVYSFIHSFIHCRHQRNQMQPFINPLSICQITHCPCRLFSPSAQDNYNFMSLETNNHWNSMFMYLPCLCEYSANCKLLGSITMKTDCLLVWKSGSENTSLIDRHGKLRANILGAFSITHWINVCGLGKWLLTRKVHSLLHFFLH